MDANGVVWIANFAGHDYTGLERYGEVRYITKGFVSFQSLDRVKFRVAEGMIDVKEEDWLVLSGASIINVLAAIIWFNRFKRIKLLNYDKTKGDYRELIVTAKRIGLLDHALSDGEPGGEGDDTQDS